MHFLTWQKLMNSRHVRKCTVFCSVGKKGVKVVELSQFESLGGKVSYLKLWRQKCKSVNISGEVKCNFSQYFAI
jgi:hypothetical protein